MARSPAGPGMDALSLGQTDHTAAIGHVHVLPLVRARNPPPEIRHPGRAGHCQTSLVHKPSNGSRLSCGRLARRRKVV